MKMKILVSGATGFVGRHLVPLLAEHGHDVIACYNTEARRVDHPAATSVQWKRLDIFNPPENPFEALGEPDCMIHLAWSGLPNYKDHFHLTENLPADQVFLVSMLNGGLGQLLGAGTCFEYGMQEGELSEDMKPDPDNPYGEAKNLLRKHLEAAANESGTVFQWARLFYMYGLGQNERSLFSQLQAAIDSGDDVFDMSGGQQVRDYLPVKIVAEYLAAIAFQSKVTGIINVCSGRNVPLVELVKEYLDERGAQIELNLGKYPYPDWEPFRFWGSTRKLQKVIEGI